MTCQEEGATMKRYLACGVMVLIWLGCLFSFSSAKTYEVAVSEYRTIEDEGGSFRVLLDFALPEGFGSFDIEMAKLTATFSPGDAAVEIWVYPLTTSWSSGDVDWEDPWSSPGGDYDAEDGCGVYMVRRDAPVATFVVTEALQILQKEGGYYGFVMMPLPHDRTGFDASLLSCFQGVSGVKLVICTR
jgi:hypothetical protein